jgi:hypothetical protein
MVISAKINRCWINMKAICRVSRMAMSSQRRTNSRCHIDSNTQAKKLAKREQKIKEREISEEWEEKP